MEHKGFQGPLEQIDATTWRIPRGYKPGMRVDGLIYASEQMMGQILSDQAPEQVANVATLPGIQGASLAMPDIHWGYGFCIGGVCATDPAEGGVVSPGGVGYDINCGVRLMRTNLSVEDVRPVLRQLVDALFRRVPVGVGKSGRYRFDQKELRKLMAEGAAYLKRRGQATSDDIEHTEARGCLPHAGPEALSERALERGEDQCGTLGSGNHFLEVQVVDRVEDSAAADVMNLREGQTCVLIHSGSRGCRWGGGRCGSGGAVEEGGEVTAAGSHQRLRAKNKGQDLTQTIRTAAGRPERTPGRGRLSVSAGLRERYARQGRAADRWSVAR